MMQSQPQRQSQRQHVYGSTPPPLQRFPMNEGGGGPKRDVLWLLQTAAARMKVAEDRIRTEPTNFPDPEVTIQFPDYSDMFVSDKWLVIQLPSPKVVIPRPEELFIIAGPPGTPCTKCNGSGREP